MVIVVSGGTGFVGGALVDALIARGDKVVLLARDPKSAQRRWDGKVDARLWNGRDPGPWVMAFEDADAVINLAGEGVADERWTPERKLALIRSRVDTTRAIVAAIAAASKRPRALLNASAVGYYGSSPAGTCAESSGQGSDFLAALCGQWEREAGAASSLGVRVVPMRLGVVLEKDGGALAKMLTPFKLGLGGPLGSGKQPFPWIHRADLIRAMLFLLEEDAAGPVNMVAPQTPTNAAFAAALGKALHRPAFLPAPAFAVKLALGEMSSMLLEGQDAAPRRLLEAEFDFDFPEIGEALADILSR